MDKARYDDLMSSPDIQVRLTPEELALGWHYCWEWNGLLVGPGMNEFKSCACYGKKRGTTEAPKIPPASEPTPETTKPLP